MIDNNTDETEHDGPTIELPASVHERFEEEREKTKTDHVPPMDQATFLSALLDTNQAVRDGYYNRSRDTEQARMDLLKAKRALINARESPVGDVDGWICEAKGHVDKSLRNLDTDSE